MSSNDNSCIATTPTAHSSSSRRQQPHDSGRASPAASHASSDGDVLHTVPIPRATFSFQDGFQLVRGNSPSFRHQVTSMVDAHPPARMNEDDNAPLFPSERRRRARFLHQQQQQHVYGADGDGADEHMQPNLQDSITAADLGSNSSFVTSGHGIGGGPHNTEAGRRHAQHVLNDVAAELASGHVIYGLNNAIDSDEEGEGDGGGIGNNQQATSCGGGGGGDDGSPSPPPSGDSHHDHHQLSSNESFARRVPNLEQVVAPSGVDICGRHVETDLFAALCTCGIVLTGVFITVFYEESSTSRDELVVLNHTSNTSQQHVIKVPTTHDKTIPEFISALIGWWYFLAWSASFVPQIYTNWRRKSVIGQSFDFQYLNVLGYTFLTIYDSCFYWNDEIRHEYQVRFGSKNEVEINDVFFAVFAITLTLWNCWQIAVYERGDQKTSKPCKIFIALATTIVGALAVVIFILGIRSDFLLNPLDLLYVMGCCKALVTATKYIPQVKLNYKRKCTVGWNVYNVLLDWTGGALSVVQEVMDAAIHDDYGALLGNWVKLALGGFSFFYDSIFIVQHFCLYNENNRKLISLFEARRAALKEREEAELEEEEAEGMTEEMKAVAPPSSS